MSAKPVPPRVVVLGPNWAGKSTAAPRLLRGALRSDSITGATRAIRFTSASCGCPTSTYYLGCVFEFSVVATNLGNGIRRNAMNVEHPTIAELFETAGAD